MIELNKETFEKTINSNVPVLVKFYMPSCSPCKLLEPTIEKLSQTTVGIAFFAVNVDQNPEIAQKYQLKSVPALILFLNGIVLAQMNGVQNEEQIQTFLDKNLL